MNLSHLLRTFWLYISYSWNISINDLKFAKLFFAGTLAPLIPTGWRISLLPSLLNTRHRSPDQGNHGSFLNDILVVSEEGTSGHAGSWAAVFHSRAERRGLDILRRRASWFIYRNGEPCVNGVEVWAAVGTSNRKPDWVSSFLCEWRPQMAGAA